MFLLAVQDPLPSREQIEEQSGGREHNLPWSTRAVDGSKGAVTDNGTSSSASDCSSASDFDNVDSDPEINPEGDLAEANYNWTSIRST
jgi:hypothetical protein